MGENAALISFLLASVGSGLSLWVCFRKFRVHRKKTILRLVLGNLLVFAFLCVLGLLAGEIYFRFIYDTTDSFGLTKTTQRWFARNFKYNDVGLRDSEEYFNELPPGGRRIAFLGDSFTVGHGVSSVADRFANRVRAMMPDVEVHVLARSGMDTGAEVDFLLGVTNSGYELDVVVLVYCLNDISDIVPEWRAILKRIYARPAPGFWVQNSYLCNWLYFRWFAAQDLDVASYYAFVRDNYDGPVWDQQAQRLASFRTEVTSRGGQLMVVTFPFLHNLGPKYDYQPVHEKLEAFWNRQNVPHLDLLRTFESLDSSDVVVNSYDAHPNEYAHALAAHAIADFLQEQGLPQSDRTPRRDH